MRQKSGPVKEPAAQVLKSIRRATRRHFSAEDKIRIVLEGLRGAAGPSLRRGSTTARPLCSQ
jgi:transposase-like protein